MNPYYPLLFVAVAAVAGDADAFTVFFRIVVCKTEMEAQEMPMRTMFGLCLTDRRKQSVPAGLRLSSWETDCTEVTQPNEIAPKQWLMLYCSIVPFGSKCRHPS